MNEINIIHGDSISAMQSMKDNQYQLSICDVPYGLGIDGQKEQINNKNKKHNRKKHKRKDWDSKPPGKKYFDELSRVSENRIIWGANYFPQYLTPSKGWIVWYKGQDGLTMSDCEIAFSSYDTPTRVCKINRVQLKLEGETIHPTQKTVKLYKWLLKNYAKPGDKIYNSHGGSMSHAIAAIDMGFDLDIYELDKDYYDAAVKRIKNYVAQTDLSRPPVQINYITL